MTGDEVTRAAQPDDATLAPVVPLRLRHPAPEPPPVARPGQRTSSSVLMAAMLGLADAMGFERPRTELVTMAQADTGEDGGDALIIGFGPLDSLD